MRGIFKMKKLLIVILFMVVMLSGCFKNEYIEHEGSLTLTIREEYAKEMHYENIPSYTFVFEGIIKTNNNVPQPYYTIFQGNDDFHLSEQINNLFIKYKDKMEIMVVEEDESDKERLNRRDSEGNAIPEYLDTDDGKVYLEVAFIELENGMKLSLDYRHFISGGVDYYVWRYQSNISMTLYYPLMVVEEQGQKEIVLLTLPNRIKYQVGPQLKIVNIMKDPDYLEDGKYTLGYLEDIETPAAKKQHVIDYYIEDMGGVYIGEHIHFEYLGVKFSVELLEQFFVIRYEGKA